MRTRLTALLGSSLALTLVGCGPGGSDRSGLILSKSLFDENSAPMPAALVLMRPPSDSGSDEPVEWSEERVVAQAGTVELQTGTHEGELVYRRVAPGPDGTLVPEGPALDLQARGTRWAIAERADLPVEDVAWDVRGNGPQTKLYELEGGNVFHKGMWWEPAYGDPGILTISANMPYLQVWRERLGSWEAETLWTAKVGGKEQRFRDVEVGDVDGDGADELVVVTHDLGAIFVLEQTPEGLQATQVHKLDERTFVHEVEICDVDGDGALEFFTTPSEPNKLSSDGHAEQGGGVDMFRFDAASGSYARQPVVHWEDRHAKEILGYDYDTDGKAEIYAAVEGEELAIQVFRWDGSAMAAGESIPLEGGMCRFLSGGDTNGDGVREVVASTKTGGVFALSRDDQGWKADKIVADFSSSGFEHATLLLDWDRDGSDDLFIASDDQKRVQRVWFDPTAGSEGRYRRERLVDLKGEGQYLTWNVMELPPGR